MDNRSAQKNGSFLAEPSLTNVTYSSQIFCDFEDLYNNMSPITAALLKGVLSPSTCLIITGSTTNRIKQRELLNWLLSSVGHGASFASFLDKDILTTSFVPSRDWILSFPLSAEHIETAKSQQKTEELSLRMARENYERWLKSQQAN